MTRSLRVLLLAHNVENSGTYYRFRGFARHLAAQGHQVTLVAASAHWLFRISVKPLNGARLILTPTWLNTRISNGGLAPEDILCRLGFVFDKPYHIVHASEHRPATAFPAAFLRALRGATLVSDWADLWGYGGIMDERSPKIQALLARFETISETRFHASADAVTVICQDLYERANHLGIPSDRLLNIPNGADTDECQPITDRVAGRRTLGLPASGQVVLYAGEAPIDMDLLWSSFRELHRLRPGINLVILGRKWQLPSDLGAAVSNIVQMGRLPSTQYYRALACADVLLLPCRNTSRNRARWPGKLSNYMAAGRPIVANPTGDIRPLLEQHRIGLLAGEGPAEFAGAVGQLLDNPGLADELGHNGREVAETLYRWPLIATRLSAFYERVACA